MSRTSALMDEADRVEGLAPAAAQAARTAGYAVAALLLEAEECERRADVTPSATARDELRRIARRLRQDATAAEVA